MAWTAQVAAKQNTNGILTVNIAYTDGVNFFNEVIDLSGGDVEGAKTRVRNRLAALSANDSLFTTIPIGFSNFTASPAAPSPLQTFVTAMRKFQACQRAVALGLMATTDAAYPQAQSAMLTAWDVAFIDSV